MGLQDHEGVRLILTLLPRGIVDRVSTSVSHAQGHAYAIELGSKARKTSKCDLFLFVVWQRDS